MRLLSIIHIVLLATASAAPLGAGEAFNPDSILRTKNSRPNEAAKEYTAIDTQITAANDRAAIVWANPVERERELEALWRYSCWPPPRSSATPLGKRVTG
jgi:hypothetical protein